MTGWPLAVWNRSLICALTSVSPAICQSGEEAGAGGEGQRRDVVWRVQHRAGKQQLRGQSGVCMQRAGMGRHRMYKKLPKDGRQLTFGSWMKPWPDLVLGGSSPVQACLRHSMMVCVHIQTRAAGQSGPKPTSGCESRQFHESLCCSKVWKMVR